MARTEIPAFWLVLQVDDIPKVYGMIKKLLDHSPVSHSELAETIGVDQSTVSRWAAGKSRPSPEQMKAVVAAIQARVEKVQQRLRRTSDVLNAVDAAVEVWQKNGNVADPVALRKSRLAAEAAHRLLSKK